MKTRPSDSSNRIVAGCPSNEEANKAIASRGGLLEDPRQVLRRQVVLQDMGVAAHRSPKRGNITINSKGIFGTGFSQQQTPESDITATGKTSQLQGVVQINTPDVDPTRGLTQLPSVPTNPSNRIVPGCPTNEEANFVISGRGGLLEDPRQVLRAQIVLQDMRVAATTSPETVQGQIRNIDNLPITNKRSPLVEATGWIINTKISASIVTKSTNIYVFVR